MSRSKECLRKRTEEHLLHQYLPLNILVNPLVDHPVDLRHRAWTRSPFARRLPHLPRRPEHRLHPSPISKLGKA
jgi:hypothetical protein